ncbi:MULTISPECIES: antiviral reverse transcriptase Drt3a [Vibrio harveyi group]|uniref:antiviral reverse transcriptase Drt3a n=1 Tax=Vibrio harveyi group TaxID=717610 RepID=UPI0013E0184F|nr:MULTISPECIES: antiviral reverse transcriptase Drt3a [Vibrio harveyi group]MCR9494840.1 RNA-directed DNA polymerase [Vibrio alginolyticus]MCR9504242.1 RNA-directed DNA polymerase [Vibrio alginolyticus]MCS0400870.1 RNA-directed DNA polymerase [Vibrio diabolicus]QOV28857.1 RNA-directed DNA polymerase [Vibrio diabolicus]QOV29603.1 RNA-directed DNA polymerase [Vibrio diabolicus]
MLRQDFSTRSLLNVTTKNEIIKFQLGRNRSEYILELDKISEDIENNGFNLSNINTTKIGGKTVYYTDEPGEHYCLKKISSDLKRLYKISTSNRDDITEQVLKILETSSSYGLIRIDIKSFYESIDYEKLIIKLNEKKLLSSESSSILSSLKNLASNGLPRGLSISPVLSEIFMINIDTQIRSIPGVYYYSRYVDDIFILSTKKYEEVKSSLDHILKINSLETNNKTFIKNIPSVRDKKKTKVSFDYLGYKYIIHSQERDSKRLVDVTLADDKIRKIKTRIVHSLLARSFHRKTSIYQKKLLKRRIDVLSGNYPISSSISRNGTLKGGIYYSNRLVNNPKIFEEFNIFIKKSVYTKKNNFFGRAMNKIPLSEKKEITQICFKEGFTSRKYLELNGTQMKYVKQCWNNKNHKKKR